MHKTLMACLALVGALWIAPVARAQTAADDARAHYEAGKKAFRLGDYDDAIKSWREGYKLKGDPKFLYNIGQAYREKGDLEQAVQFLRSYLREEKEAPNREQVESRISEMEALIAARNQERAKPPTGPFEPGANTAHESTGKTTESSTPHPLTPAPTEKDRAPGGNGKALKISGIAVGGAGVAMLATGVFFRLRANSAAKEISDAAAAGRPWDEDLQATDDRGRSAAKLSPIFLGVGAGALVAGGVLFYLGLRDRGPARETAFTPTVGTHGVGFVFEGSF
jgi:tetratricopeptide (TPR) repeat protein